MPFNFVFLPFRGRRFEQLVKKIALQVSELADQPVSYSGSSQQNLLNILLTISALLANLQEQKSIAPNLVVQSLSTHNDYDQSEESQHISQHSQELPNMLPTIQTEDLPTIADNHQFTDTTENSLLTPLELSSRLQSGIPSITDQRGITATAQDLIELSDWILLAKSVRTTVQPEVLDEIYLRLTKVLVKFEITVFDEGGPCDYEFQMVKGTRVTSDPTLDDHVYSTVRPGYFFRGELLRPQEVIVYVNENG